MPIYEYQCKGCGHEFEREQRISEDPIKKCPKCGAAKAKRLISRTSFVLKGGGWYGDLYGSVKPAAEAKGEKEAAEAVAPSAAAPAGEAKAESKPEKPAEQKSDKKKSGKGKAAA